MANEENIRDKNGLTTKQNRFVVEYIKHLQPKEAAIKAGYTTRAALKQGEEMLKQPIIEQAIERELQKQTRSLKIGKGYLVKRLIEIVEYSLVEEDLTDKNGESTGKTKLKDPGAALRAIESLARHMQIGAEHDYIDYSEPQLSVIEGLDKKKI